MKRLVVILVIVLSLSMIGCSGGKSVTDSQEYQNLKNEYDKLKNEIAETGLDSDNIEKKLEDIGNALKEMEQGSSENDGVSNIKKGQIIEFGSYDGIKREPIEWIGLDVNTEEGSALLLSKYCLAKRLYNEEYTDVTWETCTLRKWLNENFYNVAFNEVEKEKVLLSIIENPFNPIYGTSGGNDTKDKVFLLSYYDIMNSEYGFSEDVDEDDINRRCTYSENKGQTSGSDITWPTADGESAVTWYLRTPGDSAGEICHVNATGDIDKNGDRVSRMNRGVRPAIYISLKIHPETIKVVIEDNQDTKGSEKQSEEKSSLEQGNSDGENSVNNRFENLEKGQVIEFGNYEQDGDESNGKEAIEWEVLSVDESNGKALLLSKYCLESRPYNDEYGDVTWETCFLRKWLNDDFYNEAFERADKEVILSTRIKNNDNSEYGTSGGNDTDDKIFLLSESDLFSSEYGFKNWKYGDINRRSAMASDKGIDYSKSKGFYDFDTTADGERATAWWLRSPGKSNLGTCYVDSKGAVDLFGFTASNAWYGVRPALYININS